MQCKLLGVLVIKESYKHLIRDLCPEENLEDLKRLPRSHLCLKVALKDFIEPRQIAFVESKYVPDLLIEASLRVCVELNQTLSQICTNPLVNQPTVRKLSGMLMNLRLHKIIYGLIS